MALSVCGLIPYIGDLAKVGKIGKDFQVIKNAITRCKKRIQNPYADKTLKDVEKSYKKYVSKGKLKPASGSAPGNKAYVNTNLGTRIIWILEIQKRVLMWMLIILMDNENQRRNYQ